MGSLQTVYYWRPNLFSLYLVRTISTIISSSKEDATKKNLSDGGNAQIAASRVKHTLISVIPKFMCLLFHCLVNLVRAAYFWFFYFCLRNMTFIYWNLSICDLYIWDPYWKLVIFQYDLLYRFCLTRTEVACSFQYSIDSTSVYPCWSGFHTPL